MKLREVRLSDRAIFEQFLGSKRHDLSCYHFSNIFIWSGLFKIFYVVLGGNLCVFFKDKAGCFMYLPALGNKPGLSVIKSCFAIMDESNVNKDISRIENVEARQLGFYRKQGYTYYPKPEDYLCNRRDVAFLKGNRFKSKRASYNYFIKQYDFQSRPFLKQDTDSCLFLYKQWAKQRRGKFSDPLYRYMLEDSSSCHKLALENYLQLGLIGYVVEVKDKIAGYTFGFSLNPNTFCILFEICDLAYKGISQFIFSEFCRRLSGYEYVNIMDDSELLNLRSVKLSYRPVRRVGNFVVKR